MVNLFADQTAGAVDRALLEAKWSADEERRREAQDRLDLYHDDYEDIIRKTLAELFHKDNFKRLYYHVNQSQNILKRIVNEISMVYKAAAARTLEPASKRFADIIDAADIDLKLKKVNRYSNLMNEAFIRIGVRGGELVFDILTPNMMMVIQNYDDPTKADAMIYQVTYPNTADRAEIRYYYFDVVGNYLILDERLRPKQAIYTPENYPYRDASGRPIIPIVTFHRAEPDDTFFDQDSGRDMTNAAIMIGVKMTLFDYYFKSASFKQPYIIGDEINVPAEQVADPTTFFRASGQGAQIGTLDLQINAEQLQNALVFQINSIINNYGISADAWTMSVAETSGRALKIRNQALLEFRQDQLPLYRKREAELFDVIRIVNNAHAGALGWEKIPESTKFSVDFGEVDFPEDPEVDLRYQTKRLRAGLISLGAFYQYFNPDVENEKEAEAKLLENLDKLKELTSEHSALDEALNIILGKGAPGSSAGNAPNPEPAAAGIPGVTAPAAEAKTPNLESEEEA